MPLWSRLRTSPALWLSPLLLILALLATNIIATTSDPYALAHAATGAYTVFLIAPCCAACGAWEGGRLLRAGWINWPHVRSSLQIAIDRLGRTIAIGLITSIIAMLARLLNAGIVMLPDLRIVGMVAMVIAAHTVLGFAIGTRVSPVIAVPALFLFDYGWMVLPIALEPLWLRHLNGSLTSCCQLGDDLALQAFTAPITVALGIAATAVLLLQPSRYRLWAGGAVIPLLLALVLGAAQVRQFGVSPVVNRVVPMVCAARQPRVCVWPEHRARLDDVTQIVSDVVARWRAAGLPVPVEFNERNPGSLPPGAVSFNFSIEAQRVDIIDSLGYSITPPLPACANQEAFYGGGTPRFLNAWFARIGGLSDADIAARYDETTVRTFTAVRALPFDQQLDWVQTSLAVMQTCDRLPAAVPGL